jgi:hypothetical protein
MKSEQLARGRRVSMLIVAAAMLCGLMLGALTAWATRPRPLLEVSDGAVPTVERQETVRDQYLHAAQIGSVEAWRSVAKHFPPETDEQNKYYANRAKQRLAELHVQNDQLDQAMMCYDDLVEADDSDSQFQVIGLIGQANVLVRRGEKDEAKQKLLALIPLSEELPRTVKPILLQELDRRLLLEYGNLRRDMGYPPLQGRQPTQPKN